MEDTYTLTVTPEWIRLVRDCVDQTYKTWPGGDPREQIALEVVRKDLDRVLLEVSYNL